VAELIHLVREAAGQADGALILNHGRATSERDLYPLFDELDPERRLVGVAPGAPLTGIPPGGRHWYLVPRVGYPDPETFASSYAALTSFLDDFLAEREISWERTVIGGFSMGAVMSYAVGLGVGRPSPAGILAFSGFVPTVQGWRPELETRRGLPVLIHHGRMDPIIEVEFGRTANELLSNAGLDVEYIESEAGHWLPPEIVARGRGLVGSALEAAGPRSSGG
jgi:phospholipase/carboxylesterase